MKTELLNFVITVNIQYSRTGAGTMLTSPAVFSECLARLLIYSQSQWVIIINKFKIDTLFNPPHHC